MNVIHDKENNKFTMNVNSELAFIDYKIKDDKMSLMHSEIPVNQRGKGTSKILVEKTFKKLTKERYNTVAEYRYVIVIAKRSDKWNTIIEQA